MPFFQEACLEDVSEGVTADGSDGPKRDYGLDQGLSDSPGDRPTAAGQEGNGDQHWDDGQVLGERKGTEMRMS